MTSQTISHYRILEKLGAGAMGEVYLARDERLDRTVALKILKPDAAQDAEQTRRFIQEAKAASALSHPNVAHIYEIGEVDEVRFIAMEHIEGQSLDLRIDGRSMDLAEIVNIGIQVADALDEAHSKGIIHRDLKPSNTLITSRGQVKILDFGLAKMTESAPESDPGDARTLTKTEPGMVMGTIPYMSPEQALGREVDTRTDLFSLGVMLYEMATGRLPFVGANAMETLNEIMHTQPASIARFNDEIPTEFERLVRKCLEKSPKRRYQSAREVLIDLENLQRDLQEGTATTERMAVRFPPLRRRYLFALLALIGFLLLSLAIYLFMGGRNGVIDSVAVLPFLNENADPELEYLSDGITENIINRLSQLPQLRVMARSTVFHYKGQEVDPRTVGQTLNVRAVLTGRIFRLGESLVIKTELVDVADGAQIWGDQYTSQPTGVLIVQEEISRKISEELRLELTGEQQKQLVKRHTDDAEAYQLYLKGRYAWNQRTAESIRKSIDFFRQAIAQDPSYALAYAGLADSYALLGGMGIGALPPRDVMPKAEMAALKALEIDNTLAEAHASLGLVKWSYDWDWAGAEQEFQRAIALSPSYPVAHQWYALHLITVGKPEQALVEMKHAQDLDPLSPAINMGSGWILYLSRQFDQAIEHYRKTVELEPRFALVRATLGLAYLQKAMYDAALEEIQKAVTLSGNSPDMIAVLGHAYARSGKKDKAQAALDELLALSKRRYVPAYGIAIVYIGLGQNDRAFEWLQKAYEERSEAIVHLSVDPTFDRLRADPRLTDLARRVGLVP